MPSFAAPIDTESDPRSCCPALAAGASNACLEKTPEMLGVNNLFMYIYIIYTYIYISMYIFTYLCIDILGTAPLCQQSIGEVFGFVSALAQERFLCAYCQEILRRCDLRVCKLCKCN